MQKSTKPVAGLFSALTLLGALQLSACGSPDERAMAYLDQGKKFLADHDTDRASVQLRNAVKIKKDLVEAWQGLAQIEELKQQWPAYVGIMRTILEIAPGDVGDRLKLARILLVAGAPDEAQKLVDEAYELNNQDPGVLSLKAALLSRNGDHDAAVREANAARAIDPESAEPVIVLAAELVRTGDIKGAMAILDDERVARSKDIGVDLFKLTILAQTGDAAGAESLLLDLVKKFPDRAAAFRQQLIRFYLDHDRKEDAERELTATVASDPKSLQAVLDYVRFLYTYRSPDAARQDLEARIDGRIPGIGDVFPLQMALVDLYRAQGLTGEAVSVLESLAKGRGAKENIIAAQNKLADIYIGQKKMDAASAVIADVLAQDRRNVTALRLRALIRVERGEIEAGIADLREAINDQSQSPDLLMQLAAAYERSGNIELAEKQFADATRLSNFNPVIGLNYVGFLRRRGSAQRAEDILIELQSRNPKDVGVMSTLAEVRLARQDWDGAQQIAEDIRKLGNDRGLADQISGAALIGGNKLDDSIRLLQRAYDADPAGQQPMIALVSAMARAKRFDQAIDLLQSLLKANPGNAQALAALGAVYLGKKEPDQALRSFQAAIDAQPKNPIGYRALADMYISESKFDEAEKVLKTGIKVQPDSPLLRLVLANILESKRDYEGAISEYKYLLDNQQGSLIIINNLASDLADYRTDKASLEQALTLAAALRKSPIPQFKDTLGWVNYQNGKYKEAVTLLEEAARELPNVAAVQYHLGKSYISVGELDKAAKQLKVALAQKPDPDTKAKIEAALKQAGG